MNNLSSYSLPEVDNLFEGIYAYSLYVLYAWTLIYVTPDHSLGTISLRSSPVPDIPEFTSWVDNLGLSVADERVLLDGKWLTATHISAANTLLKSQFPSQNGLHDTCVLKQRGVWMSHSDGLVQIVHISAGHWACLSNKFSSEGNVELFDSLHTAPEEGDTIITQACSIVRTQMPSLTINVMNVGRQEGGSDCGLYAIAMAYDLCAGVDPVCKKYVQSKMRSHLHDCIHTQQLKPFPSTDRDGTKRTIFCVEVEVHCTCRMPEGGKWMVCCDGCNIWYHEECVVVPPDVRNDKNDEVPWQCPGCETGTLCILHLMYIVHVRYIHYHVYISNASILKAQVLALSVMTAERA